MKLTNKMREAASDSKGYFSVYNYDYELYKKMKERCEQLANDYGWACYTDERHIPSYGFDVVETLLEEGILEFPGPPGNPGPDRMVALAEKYPWLKETIEKEEEENQ